MKLREYCKCGAQFTGTITPDSKGFELQRIFWRIHSGKGHSAVERSQCYTARRRQGIEESKCAH